MEVAGMICCGVLWGFAGWCCCNLRWNSRVMDAVFSSQNFKGEAYWARADAIETIAPYLKQGESAMATWNRIKGSGP